MARSAVQYEDRDDHYVRTEPCFCCGKPDSPLQSYGCENETACQYCFDHGHLCDGVPTDPGHDYGLCPMDDSWVVN